MVTASTNNKQLHFFKTTLCSHSRREIHPSVLWQLERVGCDRSYGLSAGDDAVAIFYSLGITRSFETRSSVDWLH